MSPNVKDKSQIISPYKCKNDAEIQVMQKTLDRVDKKIDLLIITNERLSVQEEKTKHLENKIDNLTTRLWAILFLALGAIVTSLFKLILV